MALMFFRKPKVLTSKFPCFSHQKRLAKVTDIKEVGVFSVDRIKIVIREHWRAEDCPGKSLGSQKLFKADGSKNGRIHYFKYLNHHYQVYQGRGKARNIQVNPRHFSSFDEFRDFTLKLIGDRPAHISGIDLSFMLYKTHFSVDFLFWIIWLKNSSIYKPVAISRKLDLDVNKCLIKEFRIGKKSKIVKVYDCDIHNSFKKRAEAWQMNNCVNFELSLSGNILKVLAIQTLEDLEQFDFIEAALNKVSFIAPSNMVFRDSKFEDLHSYWKDAGATAMSRKFLELSKAKDYRRLASYLKPLYIGEKEMSVALSKLARDDWQKFKKGRLERARYPIRRIVYDMEPLFGKNVSCQRH